MWSFLASTPNSIDADRRKSFWQRTLFSYNHDEGEWNGEKSGSRMKSNAILSLAHVDSWWAQQEPWS